MCAARWTGGVALLATLCAAAMGFGAECDGAETDRAAEVIAIGPASAWTQPLTRDCAAAAHTLAAKETFAIVRYRDGSRYERRWSTARVPAPAGARVGDRVHFDPQACRIAGATD